MNNDDTQQGAIDETDRMLLAMGIGLDGKPVERRKPRPRAKPSPFNDGVGLATFDDASRYLGCTRRELDEAVKTGRIRYIKTAFRRGRSRYRFTKQNLDLYALQGDRQ